MPVRRELLQRPDNILLIHLKETRRTRYEALVSSTSTPLKSLVLHVECSLSGSISPTGTEEYTSFGRSMSGPRLKLQAVLGFFSHV